MYEDLVSRLRAELGDEFNAAYAEGGRLSLEEAVEFARRGRGKRRRPQAGWECLSPTETEVVKLVAEGLSNPQIAERMLISRKTVTTHLTHVFAKLGVGSRSELSAVAARRGM
jgi:DNA-binding CsgD family transcriptional regulator